MIAKSFEFDQLRDDNTSIGILIKPYNSINLHVVNRYLTFSMDISIYSDLVSNRFNIIRKCHSQKALINILLERIHMMSKIEEATKDNPLPNDILVPTSLNFIDFSFKDVEISIKRICKYKNLQNLIAQIT